jgi:rfaE bifunctional protein kinase chain/domain
MSSVPQIIKSVFPGRKVVIIGDLVADQFLHGTITRVSREAPVFILRHDETDTVPGGAANAAANVAALGGEPILIGVVGGDVNGGLLIDSLERSGVNCHSVVTDNAFRTTTKVRVLAGQDYAPRQQVIRIDYASRAEIGAKARNEMIDNLRNTAADTAAIIVSDYNYGVADASILSAARRVSKERSIPLIVDSRFRLHEFRDATSATPNQEEVEMILGKGFSDSDCAKLREDLSFDALLVTCGNEGMLLLESNSEPRRIPVVGSAQPVDVTGAGDTVIAAYALGLASGLSFGDAARVANHAGGIVVMKKGTAVASADELLASIAADESTRQLETAV